MIAVDFSQILISNCMAHGSDFDKGKDTDKMIQIARHTILTTLLSYKRNFGKKYGQIVICLDGDKYWRKQYFPEYKGHRKKNREESTTDWKAIFAIGDQLKHDLTTVFPFKIVRDSSAEADDVIAILCKYTQENELIQEGLEESVQKFLTISTDDDFRQLFKYKNYAQWSPIKRKALTRPEKNFLIEKIIRGDSGDGVPSVLCPNDFLMNKEAYGRATPITEKVIKKFIDGTSLSEIDRTRLERNTTLIDFDKIPADVEQRVIDTYKASVPVIDKDLVFKYFAKHRCKQLAMDLQDFF
jgi:hypothetical protein